MQGSPFHGKRGNGAPFQRGRAEPAPRAWPGEPRAWPAVERGPLYLGIREKGTPANNRPATGLATAGRCHGHMERTFRQTWLVFLAVGLAAASFALLVYPRF